jgi:hypothetical protein
MPGAHRRSAQPCSPTLGEVCKTTRRAADDEGQVHPLAELEPKAPHGGQNGSVKYVADTQST